MKTEKNIFSRKHSLANILALLLLPVSHAYAYNSGSTGADGAFNPVVDTEVVLPPDGIFNYTTVTIPAGVTVTFKKNQVNTPITWLTTGDVTIDGKVLLSGSHSADVGAAGNGAVGDDGLPGLAGPGGFDGGVGGGSNSQLGSSGFGPGRGLPATGGAIEASNTVGCGGAGAGFATAGNNSGSQPSPNRDSWCYLSDDGAAAGNAYGNLDSLPLIGGSGGGGASGGFTTVGSGGGGGGGAILIASSTTVTVNGELKADGGNSGSVNSVSGGGSGGAGAGGAIRIIATTVSGNGVISANAGQAGTVTIPGYPWPQFSKGGNGSVGRIRLEAENFLRTTATTPSYSLASPGDLFVPGLPGVRITSVAAVSAPAIPTGNADIVLPITTSNPVTVNIASNGVPIGNTVKVTVIPSTGNPVSVVSSALSGTESSATATATVDLPEGPSVLQAEVSYSVTQ
ncbi:MAG: hypothetical protein RQ982_04295 [Gammaproteobacteria bacterium]|nr:hypothetical protein [Gammaproteobacteria bacterium]